MYHISDRYFIKYEHGNISILGLIGNLWPLFQDHMNSHFLMTSHLEPVGQLQYVQYLAFWGQGNNHLFWWLSFANIGGDHAHMW